MTVIHVLKSTHCLGSQQTAAEASAYTHTRGAAALSADSLRLSGSVLSASGQVHTEYLLSASGWVRTVCVLSCVAVGVSANSSHVHCNIYWKSPGPCSWHTCGSRTWFVHEFPVSQFFANLTAGFPTPSGARHTAPSGGARFTTLTALLTSNTKNRFLRGQTLYVYWVVACLHKSIHGCCGRFH